MPNFQRDITLSGGTNDLFVAQGDYDYWFYNTNTNGTVTISKAGKAPLTISAGEVFILHLSKGEEIALSGTAGQTVSILDHADVKLIPAAKDILGKVILTDGLSPAGLGTFDNQKQLEVSLYDGVANAAIPTFTGAPSTNARRLAVQFPLGTTVSIAGTVATTNTPTYFASQQAGGISLAPAASTAIATLNSSFASGAKIQLEVSTDLSGNFTAADTGNMVLSVNGGTNNLMALSRGRNPTVHYTTVTVNEVFVVLNTVNAGAGVQYQANIVATPLA